MADHWAHPVEIVDIHPIFSPISSGGGGEMVIIHEVGAVLPNDFPGRKTTADGGGLFPGSSPFQPSQPSLPGFFRQVVIEVFKVCQGVEMAFVFPKFVDFRKKQPMV